MNPVIAIAGGSTAPQALSIIDVDTFRNEVDLTVPSEPVDLTVELSPTTIDLTTPIVVDLSEEKTHSKHRIRAAPKVQYPTPPLSFRSNTVPPPSTLQDTAKCVSQKRPLNTPHDKVTPVKKRRTSKGLTPAPEIEPLTIQRSHTPIPIVRAAPTSRIPKREPDIELDSDGEDVRLKPMKKSKNADVTDSDEEYSTLHAGYDLNNPDNWKPRKLKEEEPELDIVACVQRLNLATSKSPPRRRHPDTSSRTRSRTRQPSPIFIWDELRTCENISIMKTHRTGRTEGRESLNKAMQLNNLVRTASFKNAPGSINKIVQRDGRVVICSASVGGQSDEKDDERNPYNKDGSLIVWCTKSLQILTGHDRQHKYGHFPKHYAINDVKFAGPDSLSFASSGNDQTVRVWNINLDSGLYEESHVLAPYKYVPHDLAFKPGSSILAVAERKIHIYHSFSANRTPDLSLSVSKRGCRHNIGAMAWGCDSTSPHLFASTEPSGQGRDGFHKAFDVSHQQCLYEFNADEAGDALGLDPNGDRLALVTRGEVSSILRLYDIRRRSGVAISSIKLEAFSENIENEVNLAAFSPDGIYLALSRSDNHTHVYDSRMLERGVLYDYEHTGPSRASPGIEAFGIVQAQWMETNTQRLGLITGGNDGCVRLWNPLKSSDDPDNGTVLVEAHNDIGYFSLGDHFKGEHDLVVGDCAGEVSIFDK